MLPRRWREAYGLPWGRGERRRFDWLMRAIRFAHAHMPASIKYCPAYHQALVRLDAAPSESRTFATAAITWASLLLRLTGALAAVRA